MQTEKATPKTEADYKAQAVALTDQQLQDEINKLSKRLSELKTQQARELNTKKQYEDQLDSTKKRVGNMTTLPYLVANIVEILDIEAIDKDQQDQSVTDDYATISGKGVVIKTTTRQTIFLPVTGLLNASQLKPAELIGVNKDGYMLYEKLPTEYDARVKTMEVDEKPQEDYTDIGGLDKQIEELREAIVLPIVHKDKFENIGIRPPKGVLMHGPPGTGKTMMARACAAQTKATFLKLAGPQLVQMFIGDGAKMVRDAFQLAQEKAPAIIFIDELDAIGTKRYDSDKNGDREVQRTMLELLNQLDGFSPDDRIKVIAATNRPDILDPALLRSGRLDRKIEFPLPNEEARAQILKIHSRKMSVAKETVNYVEIARSTDEFNGAQLKAVCVEAGMIALNRGGTFLIHEDFVEGIAVVLVTQLHKFLFIKIQQLMNIYYILLKINSFTIQAKKKSSLNYYA